MKPADCQTSVIARGAKTRRTSSGRPIAVAAASGANRRVMPDAYVRAAPNLNCQLTVRRGRRAQRRPAVRAGGSSASLLEAMLANVRQQLTDDVRLFRIRGG